MKRVLIYSLMLCSSLAYSQEKPEDVKEEQKADTKYLPKGNKEFKGKKYASAEASYRLSESATSSKAEAAYNLGNAIYRQKQPGEAAYAYLRAVDNAKTKEQKHKAFHNLGNALMDMKDYQTAVEAYKNALRNNPYDDETRYNYALAKEMLKKNPPPEPPKDDKKDDKKDQDKNKDKQDNKSQSPNDDKNKGDKGDDKDKGDKGDEKDKGGEGDEKDKGDKGQNKQEKGGQQEKPADMSPSKQRMENLLDAMNNEEKKVQDKVNAQKVKIQPKKNEKDW